MTTPSDEFNRKLHELIAEHTRSAPSIERARVVRYLLHGAISTIYAGVGGNGAKLIGGVEASATYMREMAGTLAAADGGHDAGESVH